MSDIKIQPSATGSATVTLTAPVSNTARTITFPDSTSTLLASDGSAANLTSIPAANITGTLPAISATNLTAIPAGNLTGTVADARISALTASKLTGALPAISGASLTGITTGKVLQVVTGTHTGQVTTTSTTYADTGLDANITPSSTSSKILIQATLVSCYNNSINKQGTFRIMRDDTTNLTPYPDSGEQGHIGITYCPGEKINSTINFMFEDSPSSTSALNYSIYMAVQSGGDMRMNQNGQRSYIHLMEIAG